MDDDDSCDMLRRWTTTGGAADPQAPARLRFAAADQSFPVVRSVVDEDYDDGEASSSLGHHDRQEGRSRQEGGRREHDSRTCSIVVQRVSRNVVEAAVNLKDEDPNRFDGAWFNSDNQHVYDPFWVVQEDKETSSVLQVDSSWWSTQPPSLTTEIEKLVQDNGGTVERVSDIPYPHEDQTHKKLIACIHQLYNAQFDFEHFQHCLDPKPEIVTLNSLDDNMLLEKARLCVLTNRELNETELEEDFTPKLVHSIQTYCDKHSDTGVFVKTQVKSAKNNVRLRPLHSPLDVLRQLTFSKDILERLEQESSSQSTSSSSLSISENKHNEKKKKKKTRLVLLPWQSQISHSNEYRVFVQNFHVRAVAQQRWYSPVGITVEEAVHATRHILHMYEGQLRKSLPKWPDLSLDVWVDDTCCRLIEVNPGGRWGPSGSSLFEWRADTDLLHRVSANDGSDDDDVDNSVYVRIIDPRIDEAEDAAE